MATSTESDLTIRIWSCDMNRSTSFFAFWMARPYIPSNIWHRFTTEICNFTGCLVFHFTASICIIVQCISVPYKIFGQLRLRLAQIVVIRLGNYILIHFQRTWRMSNTIIIINMLWRSHCNTENTHTQYSVLSLKNREQTWLTFDHNKIWFKIISRQTIRSLRIFVCGMKS